MASSRAPRSVSDGTENALGARSRARHPGQSTSEKKHTPLNAPPVLRRFSPRFRWEHIELEPYKVSAHKGGEFAGASRQVLIGGHGERVAFHLRYFELEAGGYTSLERHRHSHVVVGARGRGLVRVGDETYTLRPMDTVYIGPEQAHQLRAMGRSRFGFFCIVNALRDKPRAASPPSGGGGAGTHGVKRG